MAQGSGVLIIAEHADGKLAQVTLEVVTAARSLVDAMGGTVTAGVIGAAMDGVAQALAGVAGVDEVVVVEDNRLGRFSGPAWTSAVIGIIEQVGPAAVLAPGTTSGRDYLPRVAARLKTGHAGDAVEVSCVEGKVVATRPMLGSRVQVAVAFESDGVATVTMRPGSSARAETTGESAQVRTLNVTITDDDLTVVAEPPEGVASGAQALDGAERIVAGGRGLGEQDKFSLIEELASELNAAVAATRPLADAGWRPHSDQIGQTGAQVSPKLYIAVGISGAVQHLVGIQNADYIVAINRDPDAPIFKIASFGIIGDLFEVVPALIQELQAVKS
ncbi:MAG: electron transfer flavoprotein subunit alpha/FixB family protein [Chloroflexota bacterium]|nr:electron transfer flavoprotein subunit alpha/FixB family protein [Chloroflexota bacterium]